MLERVVEAAVVREAKRRGVWAAKLVLFRQAGFPDRTLFARPRRVAFIECKAPGKKPSRLQSFVLRRLSALGFKAEVVDHPDKVVPFFEDWLG